MSDSEEPEDTLVDPTTDHTEKKNPTDSQDELDDISISGLTQTDLSTPDPPRLASPNGSDPASSPPLLVKLPTKSLSKRFTPRPSSVSQVSKPDSDLL
jgi:hypothetical protein